MPFGTDVKQVFINYVQRYESDDRSLSEFQKAARGLKTDADAAGGSLDSLAKSLRKAGKGGDLGEVLDRQSVARAIEDIEDLEDRYSRFTKLLRKGAPVDPNVRRVARQSLAVLQERRAALQDFYDTEQELSTRSLLLHKQIEASKQEVTNQRLAKNKSAQLKAANEALRLQKELAAVQARQTDIGGPTDVAGDLSAVGRDVKRVAKDFDATSRRVNTTGQTVEAFTAKLRQVFPIVRGLGVVLAVGLAPALASVAGALLAAAAGFGGLATAAVAVGGIIGGVLIGFFSRLGNVLDVLKKRQQAQEQAQSQASQASSQQRAAVEALRNAQNAHKDAVEGVTDAQGALKQAQKAASEEIRDAVRAQAEAARDLREANESLQETTVDAYEAMREAAEDAKDAVLDLRDAQLSLEEAKLDVREARLEFRKLAREVGLSEAAFDSVFKRITDVNVDQSQLSKLLRAEAQRQGLSEEQSIEFEKAGLRIKRALINEEQAANRVGDSRRDLKKARQEEADFARRGIAAYEPYRDALDRVADAQRDLGDATRKASELQRQGIAGNPGVVAARRQLRDAIQREAESQKDLAFQVKKTKEELSGQTGALAAAKREFDKLTPSEQRFVLFLEKARKGARAVVSAGTDPLFDSLRRIGEQAKGVGPALALAFKGVGTNLGAGLEKTFANLSGPRTTASFALLAINAGQIASILGGPLMENALTIFRNIAAAFGPSLVGIVQSFADTLGRVADRSGALTPFSKDVGVVVKAFRSFMGLIGAVGDAMLQFGLAAGEEGTKFIDFLTEGIRGFAEFAKSEDGRKKITKFFKDTAPFAKAATKFIGKFIVVFLKLFQAAAPALALIFDGINGLLDVLGFFLDQFNKLPAPVRAVLGLFATLFGALRGGFLAAQVGFGKFKVTLGFLLATLGAIAGYAKNILKPYYDAIVSWVKKIADFLGISSPSTLFIEMAKDVVRGFVKGIKAGVVSLYEAGRSLARNVVKGLRTAGGAVVRAARFVWERFVAGIRSIWESAVRTGRRVVGWVRDGIVAAARAVYNAARVVWREFREFWETVYARAARIGRTIVRHVADGITGAAEKVFDAIRNLFNTMLTIAQDILGIASPSKRFNTIGRQMMEGLAGGIKSNENLAFNRVDKMFQDLSARGRGFSFDGHKFIVDRDLIGTDYPTFAGRKYGIQEIKGGPIRFPGPQLIWDAVKIGLPGLATGGIVTGRTFAEVGEKGREAVIPLTRAVLSDLAASIVRQMQINPPGFAGARMPAAGATAAMSGMGETHQHFHVPPAAPSEPQPDPQITAALLAKEMKRRGGGVI